MACPHHLVERRLHDAVSLWAEALESYFDPERFRVKLQGAIQSFRSVTFVLQAQKSHLTGFDEWYSAKQESMRNDPKMRWLVDARNYIEKQGDLSTRSRFLVTFSNSWIPGPAREIAFAPDVMPKDVAKLIANSIPDAKINDEALLMFDRQWVDSMLPEEEVLTTLIHCYLVLQSVVNSAHDLVIPKDECAYRDKQRTTNSILPTAMTGVSFPKMKWFKLLRGHLIDYEVKTKIITREDMSEYIAEHPEIKEVAKGLRRENSFREQCGGYFEMAQALLAKDGYHVPMAVYDAEGMPQLCQVRMDDRAEKHVLMRELAALCRRHHTTWFIFIGEAWIARPDARYGPHAANYPTRKEVLVLHGVHRDGTRLSFQAIFSHVGGKIIIGPTTIDDSHFPGVMSPIVEAIVRSAK